MKADELYGVGGYRCTSCISLLLHLTYDSFLDVGNGGYEPLYAGQPAGQAPVNYGATR